MTFIERWKSKIKTKKLPNQGVFITTHFVTITPQRVYRKCRKKCCATQTTTLTNLTLHTMASFENAALSMTEGTFTGEFKGLKTSGGASIETGKGTYTD